MASREQFQLESGPMTVHAGGSVLPPRGTASVTPIGIAALHPTLSQHRAKSFVPKLRLRTEWQNFSVDQYVQSKAGLFDGSAADQAKRLLRPVRRFGKLGAQLAILQYPLDVLVGN